jgi:catechol 2,3-dioxygenase-like lactoylglutathione lyase family enzyme
MSDLTLDHVVIAVHDLDAATADYESLFGRAPSWRGEHPKYGTRNTLFRIDNTYVELLALGAGKGDKRWSGELSRFLEQRGEGIYALALGTGDIRATVKEMRSNGLEVMDPADGDGVDAITGARREWRNAMVQPKTTNGARIFFIEHKSKPDALPVAEPSAPEGAYVTRMDHAVVLSTDMEASRRVWDGAIGARLALDRTFPERNTRILFFRLRDITIEISGGAQQTQEGEGRPDRYWGITWGVGSVDAACERLAAAGIETSGPRQGIKPGTKVATVKGPQTHGVATLLIEHTAESFRPESRAPQGMAYDNTAQRRAFNATGLGAVVISTPDLFGTSAKWAETLGLPIGETRDDAASGARRARIDARNAMVELAQPTDEAGELARAMADRGQGMHSIMVQVDELDAAVHDLRAKGVLVADPEDGAWPGERVARINRHAANGVSIVLVQRR